MSVDSMQSLLDEYRTAFNHNDAKLVASFYADDARLLPPGREIVHGRAAIESFAAEFFDMGVRAVDYEVVSREQRDDLGIEVGLVTLRPSPGAPPIDTGKYVSVRRQQPDGKWMIELDIFNSNQPPPTGG